MTEPGAISAEMVKRLRDITGAGMMDCKKALQESGGDLDKAQEILRLKGLAGVERRAGRQASEGVIEAYIHGEGRVGVLVEVNCETDFVARTPDFRELAHEIALQVAALPPRWITREEVPDDVVAAERKIYEEQAATAGKPENVRERIALGKLESFYKDAVLLEQAYIRDGSKTVRDLIQEVASKVGENVVVRRFTRFELGKD